MLNSPGLHKIGAESLAKLYDVGRVNRRSLVKPKRVLDRDFCRYYSSLGKNVDDIPTWRNAKFSGIESYTAFAKYAHDEPVLDVDQQAALRLATEWMYNEFFPYVSGSVMLSKEEVCERTEGGNSPGYPWNMWHRSCDDFYDSADEYLLDEYWDRCLDRDKSITMWNSFLKEELRKMEKIEAGDIRQINGCAVEFKTAANRIGLDFNENFYKSNLKTASAVGVNKFYGGWDRLFNILAKHAEGFSLDVKRWDSHFPRAMLEIIRDFRWDSLASVFQTRDNRLRHVNLYEQIISSVTVMNWGELLQTKLGNPSGSPNTVVDNTLGLYLLVAYSYIRSYNSRHGCDPEWGSFVDNISMVLYGDDNTFTASPEGLNVLNYHSVHKAGGELGFLVTDGGCSAPRPVMDLDFLSQAFVKIRDKGIVVSKPKSTCKALASMAFRGDGDRLTSWSRACAHRINSFWDVSSFVVADGYCQYLLKLLDQEAEAEGWTDDWRKRKPEYLSLRDLWRLYTSKE